MYTSVLLKHRILQAGNVYQYMHVQMPSGGWRGRVTHTQAAMLASCVTNAMQRAYQRTEGNILVTSSQSIRPAHDHLLQPPHFKPIDSCAHHRQTLQHAGETPSSLTLWRSSLAGGPCSAVRNAACVECHPCCSIG